MQEIPQTASVCANQNFIPHLINRRRVAVLNLGTHDAEYVLVDLEGKDWRVTWPLAVEKYPQAVATLLQSPAYSLVKERDGVALLKRRPIMSPGNWTTAE